MAKRQMPEWMSHLVKEFTKPPYFLEQLLQDKQQAVPPAQKPPAAETPVSEDNKAARPSAAQASKSASASTVARPPSSGSPPVNRTPSVQSERPSSNGEFVATAHQAAANPIKSKSWTSVFRQAGYPVSLVKSYGWSVQSAEPVANILKVKTKGGAVYALKQTHLTEDRIGFLHEAAGYLRKQGFHCIAPFAVTQKKRPSVVRENKAYYATKWMNGNQVNFASLSQFGRLARTLAEFHELSRGFESEHYNPQSEFGLASMMRRRSEDLRNMLTRAETKEHPDEFDELLIRLAPALRQDAEKAIRIAEDSMCHKFLLKDEDNPGLCHLDVIPGNFIYTEDKEVYLLDLDLATYAPRVLDIAHLLRRALQIQNWQSELAYTCFVNYDAVRPMAPEEYLWVQCLMTFPYRAWRVAHTRYHVFKDRAQTEELREYAAQETRRQAFLDAYASQLRREVE